MSDKNENKKNDVLADESKILSTDNLEIITGGVGGFAKTDDESLEDSGKGRPRPPKIDS